MILKYELLDDILYVDFPEVLTENDLRVLPAEIEALDTENTFVSNRLVRLSRVQSFDAKFSGVLSLAQKRNDKVFRNSFKTALVVENNVQLGFARMYQTLIQNASMTISIFYDESKAVKWLRSDDTA